MQRLLIPLAAVLLTVLAACGVAAVLLTVLAACGGIGPLKEVFIPGGPASRESDLRKAVTAMAGAMLNGQSVKAYSYFTRDFQDRCPLEDWRLAMALSQGSLFKTTSGNISDVELKIDNVRFEGDRAFVEAYWELEGRRLGSEEGGEEKYPDYWILEDGEWKATTDDPEPCALWRVPLPSRESDLRDAATTMLEAFFKGDNVKAYSYLAHDLRQRCPLENWIALTALVRGFLAVYLGDMSDVEVKIESVRFEGNRAFVEWDLVLWGLELELEEAKEPEYLDYWILEDGKWKATTDNPAPCALWGEE